MAVKEAAAQPEELEDEEYEYYELSPTDKRRIGIAIVFAVLAIVVAIPMVWLTLNQRSVTMSFRMPEQDQNITEIVDPVTPGSKYEQLVIPEGGGGGSVIYTEDIKVDLSSREVSLMFENPKDSHSSVIVHLEIDGKEAAVSGMIPGGYELKKMTLADGVSLEPGDYTGHLKIDHYDPETGEKAIFVLDVQTQVNVVAGGA